jgi:hypothetical protein
MYEKDIDLRRIFPVSLHRNCSKTEYAYKERKK